MRSALRPLKLPGFSRLAASYSVNEFGNWLGEIALAVLVFDVTGSALASAGLFCALQFVPALAGPPLVARLEGFPVRTVLTAIYVAEAIGLAALAWLADDFNFAAVVAIACLDGSLAAAAKTFTRASTAAIAVPAGLLREANGMLNLGFTVGTAAGPAAAGLLVAAFGTQVALAADAASFLVVALLVGSIRSFPAVVTEDGDWMPRLRAGLRYVKERPLLRNLILAQAVAFVFFTIVIPIEVVFAKATLDAGDAGYGLLLTAWGVGMVVGSLLFVWLARRSLRAQLLWSTAAIGVSYLLTGLSPTLALACASAVVGGLGNGIQWIGLITAVQEMTESRFQARVIALLEAAASAAPGVGFLAGGAIATLLDPRASYLVAGAGVLLVLVFAAIKLRDADWSELSERARRSAEQDELLGEAAPLQVPVQTEGFGGHP